MPDTLVEVARQTEPVTRGPRAGVRAGRRVLIIAGGREGASLVPVLRADGHAVEIATTQAAAVDHIADRPVDLVVVERSSAATEPLDVVRALREAGGAAPVMLVATADRVGARVAALDAGADDVITAPFTAGEARARIRALLRRSRTPRPAALRVADLVLDPGTHRVTRGGGRRLALTPREFALLEYFVRNVDRVLTRSMILAHVWGVGFDHARNLVEVYVGYLRRKVDAGAERRLIRTVRGVGYVLSVED